MADGTHDPQPGITYRTLAGESLAGSLDVSGWLTVAGANLVLTGLSAIEEATAQERRLRPQVRDLLLSRLGEGTDRCAAPNAGLYTLSDDEIQAAHRSRMTSGGVTACGSIVSYYSTPNVSVGRVVYALAGYDTPPSVYEQTVHRSDALVDPGDSEQVLQLLEARCGHDMLPDRQVLDAVRDLGERALLAHRATAHWKICSGRPAPGSLLRPPQTEFIGPAIEAWKGLVHGHKRFLFIDQADDHPILWTIGQALGAGEYALLHTLEAELPDVVLDTLVDETGDESGEVARMAAFLKEMRAEVVYGVFRAGDEAWPQVFYAHSEHAREGACLAIADAQLQHIAGSPMLLRIARWACEAAVASTAPTYEN